MESFGSGKLRIARVLGLEDLLDAKMDWWDGD